MMEQNEKEFINVQYFPLDDKLMFGVVDGMMLVRELIPEDIESEKAIVIRNLSLGNDEENKRSFDVDYIPFGLTKEEVRNPTQEAKDSYKPVVHKFLNYIENTYSAVNVGE